ncbi:hypothetical protein KUTeg_015644 [Tegillarca granosa]|uniref:Uncharacterized protein n=1 Tax=Tegillarca granosa TaxID=220873 RepID=A0ABQ9EVY9_TEGGR|nr:hypothetical protein KUTeg_015644 [Tegillarca granosa]
MAGDRWIFTQSQLGDTPSRKCGIDSGKELMYRQQAANLIQDMGQRLQQIAAASIFLAAKVEEQPRKLEHVIKVMHICLHRDGTTLDTKSNEYLDMAQELVINENILLQTLGFEITVDHPHTTVVKTCQLVRDSNLIQKLTPDNLVFTIPRSSEGKDWYWYVDKSVTMELLEGLTQYFLNILDKCPSKLKKKIMAPKSAKDGGKDEFESLEKKLKTDSSAAGSSSSQPTGGAKSTTHHHHHHHHHHHTHTNHDRKSEKQNDVSNVKSEPSETTSAVKQSETSAGQPATSSVSSSKGQSAAPGSSSSGQDVTPKKPETGSSTITTTYKEYKERKERERLAALAKSSSQDIDSEPVKSEPGTPDMSVKTESSTPKIHIKLEPGTNRNDNSGKYSSKESHSRNISSGQVKLETALHIKQEPGVHVKTEPGVHVKSETMPQHISGENVSSSSSKKSHKHSAELVRGSETKIHIKKEPSSSQELKSEAPSPLKLKIKTSHLPKEKIHGDKHSSSGMLRSEQTPHGIKLSKESTGKEKSRSHGDGHREKSHKSSKHDKNVNNSASSHFSGTNGKSDLKLHINMAALQQHHKSHKNADGKSSEGHSKSRDKHSHSKQDQGAKKSSSQERHAPWTMSELTSSSTSTSNVASSATGSKKRPLSPNTGMTNDLQGVQKNKISKTESNSLRRNSSNLSVVSMDLCSDSGSVTAGEISVYNMPDPVMGMESNGRHSGSGYMGNQVPSKLQIEPYFQNLQRAIEIHKGQLMAQPEPPPPPPSPPPPPPPPPHVGGDMNYSNEPSLFDIDFFDHVPPLPDDQPPRPPTPPLEPKMRPNPPF